MTTIGTTSATFVASSNPSTPPQSIINIETPLYPRPQWLFNQQELEALLSTINLPLCELRTNKNNCNSTLVEQVLERILTVRRSEEVDSEKGGISERPNDYELLFARLYLAVEIQKILVAWCNQGMDETLKTSLLAGSGTYGGDHDSHMYDGDDAQIAALRSRSTSTFSNSSTRISLDTSSTTPTQSTPSERASKRRNVGNGEHIGGMNPPQLSLLTHIIPESPNLNSAYSCEDSVSGTCTSAKRKWEGELSGYGALTAPPSAVFSPDAVSPRSFDKFEGSPTLGSASSEKPYLCPFYVMNPNNVHHKDCGRKPFPNPRKLKEHIWRYTKPFRCPTCSEGYGRQKTRDIHLAKKNPCRPRPATEYDEGTQEYEGSREQLRDRKIETAKSTSEIVNILREYERATGLSATNRNQLGPNALQGIAFQNPFVGQHMLTNTHFQGLGLGVGLGPDVEVPRIVVQTYDVPGMSCSNYMQTGLEGQSWQPVTSTSSKTTLNDQQEQQSQHQQLTSQPGTLSPTMPLKVDTQMNNIHTSGSTFSHHDMTSPKSPTPELTHLLPSAITSPSSTMHENAEDQEYVIFESPLNTPSININYWHVKQQEGSGVYDVEDAEQEQGRQEGMVLGCGTGIGMGGLQRRSTSGSLDQLAYHLLQDIENSWDNNYPYGGYKY
ncbi:hypothetical protein BDZ91DRAFT_793489 [Kalaharituber pfeilii]|nr:hypothetical protein BDZ91DRAFT_793489 [Kalaharituber pfeilii]